MSDHPPKSTLVPIGLAVVIVSFMAGSNSGALMSGTLDFNPEAVVNLLRASFVVGLLCLAAGSIRNRRWKRQWNSSRQ